MAKLPVLLLAAAAACGQFQAARIGSIEFYGYAGLDLNRLRDKAPFRVGDRVSPKEMQAAERKAGKALGRDVTVSFICCDEQGDQFVFIGIGGRGSGAALYNPAPNGGARLPEPGRELYRTAMAALPEAVKRHTPDDNSQGYALSDYAPMRTAQLALREYALRYPEEIRTVLATAADERERIAAAHLLGYAVKSPAQIAALAAAARDPNETVRNNAVRALGVLAEADAGVARAIPAGPFIAMLASPVWTDRNKALFVLSAVTAARDPEVLGKLRAQAMEALREMAQWRSNYAQLPLLLMGRIAGIEEERLVKLVEARDATAVLEAVRALP